MFEFEQLGDCREAFALLAPRTNLGELCNSGVVEVPESGLRASASFLNESKLEIKF
jgi:hypothetical protein